MKCSYENCNNELTGKRRKFCSDKCKIKFYVDKRRKDLKRMAVEHLGGKCQLCGYSKCIQALEFHHVDGKDFGIARKGYTRAWARVKAELEKCMLVCSNCHKEIHYDPQ